MSKELLRTKEDILDSIVRDWTTPITRPDVYQAMEEYTAELAKKVATLEQWKRESIEVMGPLLDWGQKHAPLGSRIQDVILERLKAADEEKKKVAILNTGLKNVLKQLSKGDYLAAYRIANDTLSTQTDNG